MDRALLIALLMMRCRPGTIQTDDRALPEALGGPGSAAHRRRRQVYAVCAGLTALHSQFGDRATARVCARAAPHRGHGRATLPPL